MNRESSGSSGARVITPGDPDYDRRRATFNAMIDRCPACIVTCSTEADVVAAVKRARDAGLPISVRGGGHSVAGHCIGEGALVVDLVNMRRIEVDPERQVAVAGGGVTWEEYDAATQAHGLASTGGTFADTGIAGLTLGGGIGHLQGTFGFAVDCLIGARLVTADGQIVYTCADENADLFWAIRGGGGNFGVVIDFEFRLNPVTNLYGGTLLYDLAVASEALRVTRDLAANAPDELMLLAVIGTNRESGREATVVSACYQGTATEGERAVEPLRRMVPAMMDTLRPLSYGEMQATFPPLPFGLRHYWKGHFLRELSDELIDATIEQFRERPRPSFSGVLFEFISGAPTRVPTEAMAFNQRDARQNVSALGIWENPAQDKAQIDWARGVGTMLESSATVGPYINYMSADEPDGRVRAAYGEKYDRLRQIKKRYDPENVFRFNHNVTPTD
ncbi:MAG: FAD-binding oxidoreductase [Chloroflexota bacterium]